MMEIKSTHEKKLEGVKNWLIEQKQGSRLCKQVLNKQIKIVYT